MTATAGFEVAFHGEYKDIVTNERIVSTEIFEGMPDAPALSTNTFAGTDGHTTLTILVEHTHPAHRDAHINSGGRGGVQRAGTGALPGTLAI